MDNQDTPQSKNLKYLIIKENLIAKKYFSNELYKDVETILNEKIEVTDDFLAKIAIGKKFKIDVEKPRLPIGLSIPKDSKINIKILGGKVIEILPFELNNDIPIGINVY